MLIIFTSSSVVVTELDFERVSIFEPEANTPLIVDRDRELTGTVIFQQVQAVARRHLQVPNAYRCVDLFQLASRSLGDIGWYPTRIARQVELLGLFVSE